jgi:hypothetical protein
MYSSSKWQKWKASAFHLMIAECGGGGDCLFHCLAKALTDITKERLCMQDIRSMLAESLTEKNIASYVQLIADDHAQHLPFGSHNFGKMAQYLQKPRACRQRCLSIIQTIVKRQGRLHQGTDVTLKWLGLYSNWFQAANIGFVVFSSFGPGFTSIIGDMDKTDYYVLLFNHANASHWQLAYINYKTNLHCCVTSAMWTKMHQMLQKQEEKQF